MKVAIVHDYLREYGGAERVLEALCEAFPDAPIYTAFVNKNSLAYQKFYNKKIVQSWAHFIPFFATKLHSPLRFLAPLIWGSFNFSKYDVVITSASWYVTKGIRKGARAKEVCYCHTPPRWLYGYKTSIEWQRYWPVKLYGMVIGHFMRIYDFRASQKVDCFIANSEEVKARIKKYYRKDAIVVYPPVELPVSNFKFQISNEKKSYYLIVGRIVGSKGLDLAVEAANQLGIKLKIVGVSGGYSSVYKNLVKKTQSGLYSSNEERSSRFARTVKPNVEFLGYVTDEELVELYANAKGFLALAQDEDFGITPVEAMLCGTPVVAFYGGGYKETVVEGKTGVFFHEYTVESLIEAIEKFETFRRAKGKELEEQCVKQAQKFSKERFEKEIKRVVANFVNT